MFPGPARVLVEDATNAQADIIATALNDWQPGDAMIRRHRRGAEAGSTPQALRRRAERRRRGDLRRPAVAGGDRNGR